MLEDTLKTAEELALLWGARVVGVLVALFVAWIVAGWLSRITRKQLERRSFDATLTRFFAKLVRYAVLTFAVIGCLGVFGIQTASFAAVIAAMGLAVGLAFQGTLSNFASGIMLLVFRPFKVDDAVVVDGELGIVEEIELFTTELKSLDNRRIIVPNSAIFGSKIINLTHYETRRVDINVGTEYPANIGETRKTLEAMVATLDGVLADPAPQIFLKELGASSIDWQIRLWCKTEAYWNVWEAATEATKVALDDAKIGIPFPQTDIHLDESVVTALSGRRT